MRIVEGCDSIVVPQCLGDWKFSVLRLLPCVVNMAAVTEHGESL